MNDSSPQQDAVGASDSQRFRGALAWSFVLNGARQALTSLFTLALAAMLGPEEFGTVTIAFTFVLFLQLFIDQGVGEALVQRKELDEEHLTAAFWLMAGGSLLLAIAGVALSPWWAAANRLPSLAVVTAVLTLTIPLQALFVVQQALLRRRMDFRSLAVLANAAIVASGALGFLLARRGLRRLGARRVPARDPALDARALRALHALAPGPALLAARRARAARLLGRLAARGLRLVHGRARGCAGDGAPVRARSGGRVPPRRAAGRARDRVGRAAGAGGGAARVRAPAGRSRRARCEHRALHPDQRRADGAAARPARGGGARGDGVDRAEVDRRDGRARAGSASRARAARSRCS